MKTLFKKSLLVLMIAFIALFTLGISSKVKAAELVESVDFTTKAVKNSNYKNKWTYDGWTVSGGANNNAGWAYVKMGGSSSNLSSYNTIYIASPKVASQCSKVEVNIIAGSVAKSGMLHMIYTEKIPEDQVDFFAKVAFSDRLLSTAVDDNFIGRKTGKPTIQDEVILNGPHIHVGTAFYKMPRTSVENNSSYDVIDYTKISEDFIPSTCFVSKLSHSEFKDKFKGFYIADDEKGIKRFDCWLDYFKLAISEWVGPDAERTLSGGLIPPNVHHIGTIVSVTFKDLFRLVELAGLICSVPLDFYMKTTGAKHVKQYRIEAFPIGVNKKYLPALLSRTLRLNCLTRAYTKLLEAVWMDEYQDDTWSVSDDRLISFGTFNKIWDYNTPFRNAFTRRQALVEIDVITAMALGLSLQDLESMYTIQFSVMQQYEEDTWYDKKGNIVYTKNVQGLKGVGLDRKQWELIRNQKDGETYVHTIDPAKSELYGGQQVTYYAPYTKCDRIEDYRRAWAHFEKIFKEDK